MEFLWFILIGLAAGWLAGQFMRGGGYGVVGDLLLGEATTAADLGEVI